MKPILEIQNISKKFRINHEQQPYLSLRDSVSNIFKSKKTKEDFWALNDVSFNVEQGDTIGIIGKNGAGKSTLLKILSKITPPTSGKIICRGRVASLLEVGTGFHPELSGRENIFMNGSILGMRKAEILKNFDAIVDFSGVEKFIDTPLKHYSSGMQLRLAFAVAAFLENEILIIDEVLAVGDAEFQKKCMGKMGEVSKSGRTILFVSHNLASISLLCNRGLMLKSGNVSFMDNASNTIKYYLNETPTLPFYQRDLNKKNNVIYIESIKTVNSTNELCSEYVTSSSITLKIDICIVNVTQDFKVGIALLDQYKNKIFTNHYDVKNNRKEKTELTYQIPENTICPGRFTFDVALFIPNVILYDYVEDVCNINIIDSGSNMFQHDNYGSVFVNCNWIEN